MKIRGVNLGNWLVLEKWMKPDLFEGTEAEDEYHLARWLSAENYERRIRIHRAEYITEQDFAWLAQAGVNAVRLPIPFYVFGDRVPYIGCIETVDRAFGWAEKYHMKILLDLHTVPGSQNGFDNGGLCGVCRWAGLPDEVEFVLKLLEKLAVRYGERKGLLGIEPVNEPMVGDKRWEDMDIIRKYPAVDAEMMEGSAPVSMEFLQQFYREAYGRLRRHLPADKCIVLHDGFQMNAWEQFFREENMENVILDTHLYVCNMGQEFQCRDMEDYHRILKEFLSIQINKITSYVPVIVGEWCVSNSIADDMDGGEEKKMAFRRFADAQMAVWNQCEGYFFWSYKLQRDSSNESGLDGWDFRRSRQEGWIELV